MFRIAYKQFASDRRGAVAIIFGLTFSVLCISVGLGLDYARALAVRTNLQAAVDTAALSASDGTPNDPMMQSRVQNAFDYQMANANFGALAVTVASQAITQGVRVTAKADLPTSFGRVVGINTIPIQVLAEAISAKGAFEIALVLDNTGSMAGTKLNDLKAASKNLIDEVVQITDPGTVKFALVPFSNYVNVGMAYRNATWMSVPNDSTTFESQCTSTCPTATVKASGTCTDDGVSYTCSWQQCPVPEVQSCTNNNPVKHTWNGCVGSRKSAPDLTLTATFSTPLPGLKDTWCNAPLARLTTDSGSIKTQVDNLWAGGETYIASGMMWGWRVLTPLPPFSDGAPAGTNPPTRKIMVLMTDGENTKSQLDTTHDGSDTAASDAAMTSLCASIKADSIELYTIAFAVTSAPTKAKLQTCASDAGHFFDAADGAALKQAFNQIGSSLIKLSLSR